MIRKRLLSACLALALCLGLLPVTALAAAEGAPSQLYVGNQQVSSGNDITYWTTDTSGGLVSASESDSWNVKYDPTSATLTLSGATIQGGTNTGSAPYGAGIYALSSSNQSVALTIELIGENTITGTFGIYVNATPPTTPGTDASLVIKKSGDNGDNGSLTVTGTGNSGLHIISGTGDASLTIKNASVDAKTTQTYSSYAGVCVQSGASATGSPQLSLAVNGGSLTVSGSTSGDGILFYVGSSQATGATTSLTVSENAIVDARNGGIKALKISETLPTPTPTGDNRSGIVFNNGTGTVYGSVTLQENLTIGEGESLKLDNGASLNAGGHNVIVDGGTLGESLAESLVGSVIYKVTKVELDKTSLTLDVNQSETLTAAITPSNATDQNVTWSSDDESVATVENGIVTAIKAGTATITATAADGSGEKATCSVTVKEAAIVPVTSVSLDKTTLGLTKGETARLTATVEPNNATNKNVTWSTSNASIATVNNGEVTAVSAGTATITATADGKSATCTVTVTAATVPVTGVTLNKTSTSLYVGDTETLTATVQPGNASNQNVTWSTSDASVATVENGVVRATGRGTATITVTTEDGGFTAHCTVTVSRYSTGGGSTTYAITAPDAENGTVRVSPSRASRGTTVTITVTPDEGYELESLTVLDSRDNEITLTDKGDGKYTFTMPSGRVTVEASFAEIAPEPLPFGDVDDGDWFAGAVRFVYENGMMNGVSETSFAPHATTSRSMIVTILYRLEGEPVVDDAMDFTDVAGDAYYAEAVRWAASEGIVGGYGGGLFGSDDAVTREQLAVILYRYASGKGYDVSIGEDTNILSYADFADLSEYAIPAMQWACGAGVITGVTDATLVPQGEATRAQVAAMLMRFVEAIG